MDPCWKNLAPMSILVPSGSWSYISIVKSSPLLFKSISPLSIAEDPGLKLKSPLLAFVKEGF